MRYIFLLLAISVALATPSKPQFAIYLVKGTPNETYSHRGGPDLANAVLEEPPILTQDDIVVYDWAFHSITLTPSGEKKLFEYSVEGSDEVGRLALRGREFIVTVDGERCYGGAFWWKIYSAPYMHPVIDVYKRSQTIEIRRAFPRLPPNEPPSPDPRFDPRVEKALKDTGKFKDSFDILRKT